MAVYIELYIEEGHGLNVHAADKTDNGAAGCDVSRASRILSGKCPLCEAVTVE